MWMQILLRVLLLLGFENHAIFSYCQNVLLDSQNSKSALSDIIKKFWAFLTWLVTACLQRKRKKIFWCQSILASSSEHPLSLHSEAQLKILFRNYCQKNRPALKLATSLISFIIISKDKCSYDVHKFKHSSQKKFLISSCFASKWESISGYCIWIFVQHNYTSHYQMCLFFWSNHQHSTIKILCNHYSLRWRFFFCPKVTQNVTADYWQFNFGEVS